MKILTSTSHSVRTTLPSWQQELKRGWREVAGLLNELDLDRHALRGEVDEDSPFPVFAPRSYVGRMQRNSPDDPLLRQVLPMRAESQASVGFQLDPVGDRQVERAAGLLQKYHGRALVLATGVCGIHCRYCFRRHHPYDEVGLNPKVRQGILDSIAADETLGEVILSGGDPLTLVDDAISEWMIELEQIAHVKRVRVHTRMPVVIPARVTNGLLAAWEGSRLQVICVIHANHARELDGVVQAQLERLRQAGVWLMNQAVLLAGINDSTAALVELSERLLECQVTPYYLHQLDRVQGAAEFEVSIDRGRALIQEMRKLLPGYAIPSYVQEVAGEASKRPL